MARRTPSPDAPPRGYAYLTAASAQGADLRPALRVLIMLPDNRRDLSAWLRVRAAAADPAVGTYLELNDLHEDWNDWDLRREVVAILDEHHPKLARRTVTVPALVIATDQGYWTGSRFHQDRRLARKYSSLNAIGIDLCKVEATGLAVRPEFFTGDDEWRGVGKPAAAVADPWSAALDRTKVVPGCAWIPIPPALRKEMETHIVLNWHVQVETDRAQYEDTLRAAARFGHPLYTVFVEFAARQNWSPGLCDELRVIDRQHARFRDPPGEVPALQATAGPYCVLCSRLGFWDGARWTASLDEAEKVMSRDPDKEELFESARLRAEELGGVPVVPATVWPHPTDRRDEARPATRSRSAPKR